MSIAIEYFFRWIWACFVYFTVLFCAALGMGIVYVEAEKRVELNKKEINGRINEFHRRAGSTYEQKSKRSRSKADNATPIDATVIG